MVPRSFGIRALRSLALAFFSVAAVGAAPAPKLARVTTSFDSGWKFLKADTPGAEAPGFDDGPWRNVDVPHDWSIEGPFDRANKTGGAGGFLPAGVGWYRRHFTVPQADADRRVYIEFDGVMANSDVWINGFHLGHRPYGYVSFAYDLTGHLNFGAKANVLAVRADNSLQPASRWYEGAGIYRHVRLVETDAVHLEHWATFVTTPQAGAQAATVRVQTSVANDGGTARKAALEVALLSPGGVVVKTATTAPQAIDVGKTAQFQEEISVASPQLWNLETPAMYRAIVRVISGKTVLDGETVPFGIREFHFDAATGFWLNGKNFKIKGVCLHADDSALGTAIPVSEWERRLATLKELGVNAIRTAHNPPAPEFLDLCDRMGFLVMDEMFDCWTVGKNQYDYHLHFTEWSHADTRDTVMRDRNHPSIILYSAGNEIHDTPKQELARQILRGLLDVFHATDPTRPVTQALFRPNASHDYDDGLADMLDVIGQNYRENEILAAHAARPSRKIIGTENQHDRNAWLALRDNPPYAGQFLWSGIDYLGESRMWPVVAAGSGLLDRTGAVKPLGWERASWWSEKPVVAIARRVAPQQVTPNDPGFNPLMRRQVQFLDWTPSVLQPHPGNVDVYSNCQEVELLLNGKSLGSKPLPADASPRVWQVDFEPGTLAAVCRNNGAVAAKSELKTAGKAARIVLESYRKTIAPVFDDVAYITATVVDENGVRVPDASQMVQFAVSGPGRIAAVDNADNASHEPFQASERSAYHGECSAIMKATGTGRIQVTATAQGLNAGSVAIEAK